MPISDQELAEFGQRGFKLLFEDQFRRMPPRHFPDVLDRHTILPIRGHLVGQTTTPIYLLGWMTTSGEFVDQYGPEDNESEFSDIRLELRARWAQRFRGTEKQLYEHFPPDVTNKGFEGSYVLHILGNYSEKHLRQALEDDYLKTAMDFLGITEPPQWIRMTKAID